MMRKFGIPFIVNSLIFVLIFVYVYYSETGEGVVFRTHYLHLIVAFLIGNAIGFSILLINRWLNKHVNWKQKFSLRFILSFLLGYMVGLGIFMLIARIYLLIIDPEATLSDQIQTHNESFIRILILSFFILLVYLIVDFLMYSYNQYTKGQIESIVNKREQIRLQFEALKTQLSPHYLFNSLNTISSLVYKDPVETESFVRKLAKTYKFILESDQKILVSLKDEIQFVEDYSFLLRVRFGSSINILYDLPDDILNYSLPPMSLQMLVENAAKHNVFSDDDRLDVEIAMNRTGFIIVRNNILKKPSVVSSFNIGLSNIKDQYKFFTNSPVKVKKDKYFTVELPLMQNQE